MSTRCSTFFVLAACTLHCGGAAPTAAIANPAAQAQTAASASLPAPSDPWVIPTDLRDDVSPREGLREPDLAAWQRSKALPAVGPRACPAVASVPKAPSKVCDKPPSEALAQAGSSDAALAELEACPKYPPGLLRSLRAELAQPECADALTDDYLEHPKVGTSNDWMHVLVGQSTAAKLLRIVSAPPVSNSVVANSPADLTAYYKNSEHWVFTHMNALRDLSFLASGLRGYGQAVAATEAGFAELKFVSMMREAPTPAAWDAELKHTYEESLERALGPYKSRGRDATLVGYGVLAQLDLPTSTHARRARSILSQVYGGRRIDALSALLWPPAAEPGERSALAVLAEKAPYHLRALFPPDETEESKIADLPARLSLAAKHLSRGTTFWRAVDYDRVLALVGKDIAKNDTARLYVALALALRQGPRDAARFMIAKTPAELELTHTEALDALAQENRPVSGMAAFDAALLRELSPPAENPELQKRHFLDVAKRYERAAEMLAGTPAEEARARASSAKQVALGIR